MPYRGFTSCGVKRQQSTGRGLQALGRHPNRVTSRTVADPPPPSLPQNKPTYPTIDQHAGERARQSQVVDAPTAIRSFIARGHTTPRQPKPTSRLCLNPINNTWPVGNSLQPTCSTASSRLAAWTAFTCELPHKGPNLGFDSKLTTSPTVTEQRSKPQI